MSNDFGNLVRQVRGRTADPRNNGRPLSQQRLAELLGRESGLHFGASDISGWERGLSDFPTEQRALLLDLIDILRAYGGVRMADEANELLDLAHFEPLDKTEIVRLFADRASPGGPKDDQPETPRQAATFMQGDTPIQVVLAERGWRLPVDALVLPVDPSSGRVGGALYESLLSELNPPLADELHEFLQEIVAKLGPSDLPVAVRLPAHLAEAVLPFSAPQPATIIAAALADADPSALVKGWIDSTVIDPNVIDPMVADLVQLAKDQGVRRLLLPDSGWVASAKGVPSAGAAALTVALVEALIWETDLSPFQGVTVVTGDALVVDAARRKFHLLTSNRAQALHNDEPDGEDLLGIKLEVDALAETLLVRHVKAPLSVGVVGGWGSGKSFVMHLMQAKIAEIRTRPVAKGWDDDGRPGQRPSFVGHVYQIPFNAWTYAKSSLWASLMQTIFFELNRQLSLEQNLAEPFDPMQGGRIYRQLYEPLNRLREYLPQLNKSLLQVDENVLWDTLRARKQEDLRMLQETEQQIARLQAARDAAEIRRQEAVLRDLGDEGQRVAVGVLKHKVRALLGETYADTLPALAASDQAADPAQVEELFDELHSFGVTAHKVGQVARQGHWMTAGLIAFVCLALLGTVLVVVLTNWSLLRSLVASLYFSVLPLLLPLLRVALNWNRRVDGLVDEYRSLAAAKRDSFRALREQRLAERRAQDEVAVTGMLARVDLDAAGKERRLAALARKRNLVAYDHCLVLLQAQAEDQRRKAGPTAQYVSLLEFVQARQDEADYETRLGLMHQVKRDIDELTEGLIRYASDTEEMARAKRELFPRGEARVVLYIDDLDRCPPQRVVEVLEAVQLLLRTQLFVVVLGLDTRYITRALEKAYKEILQHDGDPSGLDYIEKIIQIPYRVRPIEPQGLANFLLAQMEFVDAVGEETQRPPGAPEVRSTEAVGEPAGDVLEAERDGAAGGAGLEIPEQDLAPEVARFQPDEYDDLRACCQQIILTPRSVKRLVNVLKLVKIFWFRSTRHDRPRPVKQTVIGLLALSAGYPEIMREAFVQLDTRFRDRDQAQDNIGQFLSTFTLANRLPAAYAWQIDRFRADVAALQRVETAPGQPPLEFFDVTLEELSLQTFNVVRSFSFVGDPSYAVEGDERGR